MPSKVQGELLRAPRSIVVIFPKFFWKFNSRPILRPKAFNGLSLKHSKRKNDSTQILKIKRKQNIYQDWTRIVIHVVIYFTRNIFHGTLHSSSYPQTNFTILSNAHNNVPNRQMQASLPKLWTCFCSQQLTYKSKMIWNHNQQSLTKQPPKQNKAWK